VIHNSIISPGCAIHDAVIRNSILAPGVKVMSGAVIEDCVVLPNVTVGRHSHLQRAVIDSDVVIGDHRSINHLVQSIGDDAKHFTVTANGVCLLCNVPKALPTLLEKTEEVAA
jgi:glucose-1-phosphate adenylyltransferase